MFCEVLPQKAQNEEQAVAGIRDDDIRKNCRMGCSFSFSIANEKTIWESNSVSR